MKVADIRARVAVRQQRLDAKYYTSPGIQARETLALLKGAGLASVTVGGPNGLGRVEPSTRMKRVHAATGEESVPYLRPYDVFDYLPQPADYLAARGGHVTALKPEPGTILQTCSGRNLGPLAYADRYMAQFAVSDDMLRVKIDEEYRYYVLAYLSTPMGQAILTQSMTGGVIDHLSAHDVSAVEVPLVDDAVKLAVDADMKRAIGLRESARFTLASAIEAYENRSTIPRRRRRRPLREGWTTSAEGLMGRFDAAFHDPLVRNVKEAVKSAGSVTVGELAECFIPGRYKRYYVEEGYGRPILSGRQLLQSKPINLRYIANRSFEVAKYELTDNMLAFGAEGRAEERLGFPVLITGDRAGWLANNHVMRVMPKEDVHPGALYLAFAAWQSQVQIAAAACGSVVDTVYPGDVANIVFPPLDLHAGAAVLSAWTDLSRANLIEEETAQRLQQHLESLLTAA